MADSVEPDENLLHCKKVYFLVYKAESITKTCLFIKKISPPKTEKIQIKNSDVFHICAQNIDCGYSLELAHRGSSNEYP